MKKIKVGDKVKVILGQNKGQTGLVKSILSKKNKVIVEGLNKKVKHIKAAQNRGVGKIVEIEAPIHISNVMLCDEDGTICKVGFILENNTKLRILKKTKKLIR
jgi:large subunit ribosomal protein L24